MSANRFSVAMCTCNGERFLEPQLESIARQSLLPAELVVCDDSSTDGTFEILEQFQRVAPFSVKLIRNVERLGTVQNFAKSCSLCTSEIIALADQDDVWQRVKLARHAECYGQYPGCGFVSTDAELIGENSVPYAKSLWEIAGFSDATIDTFNAGDQLAMLLRQELYITGMAMSFRRELLPLLLPFPGVGAWIHDGWIAVVCAALGRRGVLLPEQLVSYRQHGQQQLGAPGKGEVVPVGRLQTFYAYRSRITDNCKKEAAAYELLRTHLMSVAGNSVDPACEYLSVGARHWRTRAEIRTSGLLEKVQMLVSEVVSGRYSNYSRSWESVMSDLLG